jgi:hypothetical protein
MCNEALARSRGRAPVEAQQQCLVRDENELTELANLALAVDAQRLPLRCECGDPACEAHIFTSHSAYETVRARGSQFVVGTNHENPESAWIVCERDGYTVIDVIEGDARYAVLAQNTRHTFIDDAPAGLAPPSPKGSSRT